MANPSFRDLSDREWVVVLTIPDVITIRDSINVNLLEIDDVARVERDPVAAVAVLWILCESQAKSRNLSERDFGRLFSTGEVVDAAQNALIEAVKNFSRPQRREEISRVLEKQAKLQAAALRRAQALIESDQLDKIMDQQTEETLRKMMAELSGTQS